MQNCVNKPASVSKRLLSGAVDILIMLLLCFTFYNLIAIPVANKNYEYDVKYNAYQEVVTEYYLIAQNEYNLGTYNEEDNSFTSNENVIEGNEYYEAFLADERVVDLTAQIEELQDDINFISNIMLLSCLLVSELILWLIVPLANKKQRSIGMIAAKTYIIDKNDLAVSKKQTVYRFLGLYLVNTVAFFLFFGTSAIYMSGIFNILVIYASLNKTGIHDKIAGTKITYGEPLVFNSIKDRDRYLETNVKNDAIDIEANKTENSEENEVVEDSFSEVITKDEKSVDVNE